jgi:Leu/Phe-tRNA-protein transferase
VWQSLKKSQTRAGVIMIVARDDEDGGILTYEHRRQRALIPSGHIHLANSLQRLSKRQFVAIRI